MLKVQLGSRGHAHSALFLFDHGVASIAILAYHFSFWTHVLAVVATETAIEIEMAENIGMRLPIYTCLLKSCFLIDLLHFANGIANFQIIGFRLIWVLVFIISLHAVLINLQRGRS